MSLHVIGIRQFQIGRLKVALPHPKRGFSAHFRMAAACSRLMVIAFWIASSNTVIALDIEAHRGGRALFPENTLPAFANALSIGVNTLELDIGVTQDDAIIVSHQRRLNPDLARGSDGLYVPSPGVPFVQLRLEDVKKYDVGQIRRNSVYAAQFPEQRSVPGTPIPTLAEVLALVRKSGNDHVRLNIETKIDPNHPDESPGPERFVSLLLNLLQTEKFTGRVVIQSFDWRILQIVQKRAPSIPTAYLSQQVGFEPTVFMHRPSPWTAGFNPSDYGGSLPRAIKAAGGAIWSPYYGDVSPALVNEAHYLGLTVIVWTVNEPVDMARLIEMGADGIISDRPDLLRKVSGERGISLPVP